MRLLADLVEADCGERPTVFGAIQQDTKGKVGEHQHDLLCGTDQLLVARRKWVWSEFRKVVAGWPGIGQPGKWAMSAPTWERDSFAKWHVVDGERRWVADVPNDCRLRLEPVRVKGPLHDSRSLSAYVVRYCMREDRGIGLEVLPGTVPSSGLITAGLMPASMVSA